MHDSTNICKSESIRFKLGLPSWNSYPFLSKCLQPNVWNRISRRCIDLHFFEYFAKRQHPHRMASSKHGVDNSSKGRCSNSILPPLLSSVNLQHNLRRSRSRYHAFPLLNLFTPTMYNFLISALQNEGNVLTWLEWYHPRFPGKRQSAFYS